MIKRILNPNWDFEAGINFDHMIKYSDFEIIENYLSQEIVLEIDALKMNLRCS